MKIVIDKAIPFVEDVFYDFADVDYIDGSDISSENIRNADALVVRTRTKCDERLLRGSVVKLIVTATIGFDHIDIDYCKANGIGVVTAAGCNARGVLQWVAATLVSLSRRFGFAPNERTIGIVGVGNVGQLVKRYAQSWGFNVVCCDPPREAREHLGFLSLEKLLHSADILTLHVPLNDTTYHLLNDKTFAFMRSDAIVVNSSRGEVVDTQALLDSGHNCVIDVWEHEPNIDSRLLERAMIATPHIAGYSLQGKANAASMAVAAIAEYFGLSLQGWYPKGVNRIEPRNISWDELCRTIDCHYNIADDSNALKCNVEKFELLRNNYRYREEYF